MFSDTHYVSKTGGHVSPFISWANAATNIQASVDAASEGDTVLVNDGTYYPVNHISITNDMIIISVNGAKKTIVNRNTIEIIFVSLNILSPLNIYRSVK